MALRPAPRSGCPSRPALPCPVCHHRQTPPFPNCQAFQMTMLFPMAGSAVET